MSKSMVSLNDLQWHIGVAWPTAQRFCDRYGFGREIVGDVNTGPGEWYVPEEVAEAVLRRFKEETAEGHDYERFDKLDPRGYRPKWNPQGGGQ